MRQLVFIDDSGDPGFKPASSSHFVMAAALFMDPEVAFAIMQEMDEYRQSLGWRYNHEFRFKKNPKNIIVELLRKLNKYDFQIYATYVDKSAFQYTSPFIDKEKLYNWTIKELLSIIPLTDAKIEIDGRSSEQNMHHTATYLRREINNDKSKKLIIKFEDSVNDNLIQLADIIAGSIHRYLNADKTDYTTYMHIIEQKIIQLRRIGQR